MKQQTAFALFAILFAAAAPSLPADTITFYHNPAPCIAPEDTKGNICFVTLTNDSDFKIAHVTDISLFINMFLPKSGEADDKATNPKLIGPNPTVVNDLLIAPKGTANIKFSWDAEDNIHDNDIDSGDWTATFQVTYHYISPGDDMTVSPIGVVRVVDTPEPSSLILLGTGLFSLSAFCCLHKRKVSQLGA
jgi:hypothetical protein